MQRSHYAPARFIVFMLILSSFCVLLAACKPVNPPPTAQTAQREPMAVIVALSGKVHLTNAADQNGAARPFQVLFPGNLLQLSPNAKADIVCFQERILSLAGPVDQEINDQSCASGAPLPANIAQLVKPDAGRILLLEGSLALEEQAREKETDYGNLPIILSPRNTSLLDLKPTVQWVAVEGAIEYQFSLSGLAAFDDLALGTEKVTCTPTPDATGSRVCTIPWPDSWTLEPGQRYFLTINALTGIAAPLRPSTASALRTLTAEEVQAVQTEETGIQALAVDTTTQTTLLVGLYAQHELYAEAIPAYEEVLTTQPAPILYLALGDLYRAVDLQRYAFNVYQQALDLLGQAKDDLAVRAASEFGMGQVEYSRGQFAAAEPYFQRAVEIYVQTDTMRELKAAQEAYEKARQHR